MPTHAIKLKPTHIRTEKIHPRRRTGSVQRDPLHGCAGFFLVREYQQRCVVKVSYIRNAGSRSWAAHGDYLQREHAQTPGERGLGFDAEHDNIDLKSLLRSWQKDDDGLFFKIIVSPENGYKMDLHEHARDLMKQIEKDLDTKLEWAAIDHHNTDYPHLHIVVRGIDEDGDELRMESRYISHGIRERSQLFATRELGLQRNQDIIQQREQHIERDQVTEIDRSLRHRADEDGVVSFKDRVPDNAIAREWRLQEIGRLKYLETLDLAKQIEPKVWEISDKLEETLSQMKLENEIVEARGRHGLNVTYQEEIAPTEIEEDSSLTGKVVGMGLENELYDKRYLIVEGTDGKAHYLQASNNMVRQHDEGSYHNGEVVTVSREHFTNNEGEQVSYLSVESHGSMEELKLEIHSKLDDDTIEFVKTTGQAPQELYPSTCFGHEYAQAMAERFEEFDNAKMFYHDREEDKYYLAHDCEQRYEQVLQERQQQHAQSLSVERSKENELSVDHDQELQVSLEFDQELAQENELDVEQKHSRDLDISF